MTSANRRIHKLFEPAHTVGGATIWRARKGVDPLAVYQLATRLGWHPHGPGKWFDPSAMDASHGRRPTG